MTPPAPHLVVIAGEASGDLHAAHLIDELKTLRPEMTFSGLGGPQMRARGVELYTDMTRLSVVGFLEVVKHYREIRRVFYAAIREIERRKPAAVVLVDYPGFNLRLARQLHGRGVKVLYYISPQVWAWKKNRIETIRRYTDRLLVLFEFEKHFFDRHGLEVDFVGHPLLDQVTAGPDKKTARQELGLKMDGPVIGLLPGSRAREVEMLLPVMLKAARDLRTFFPSVQFALSRAESIPPEMIKEIAGDLIQEAAITHTGAHALARACDLCVVASGTATLELALLEVPMIVVYQTSWLTWLIARALVKIPYISLVNIVAEKDVVPELIQADASPERIRKEMQNLLEDPEKLTRMRQNLTAIRPKLGAGGASRNAARRINELI